MVWFCAPVRIFSLHGRSVPSTKGGCPYNLRRLNVPDHSKQQQDSNGIRNYVLSNLKDFDERSEAGKEIYATMAVNRLNKSIKWNKVYEGPYDVVECGPIASGSNSAGRILHFNYKARNIYATDSSLETFFAELIMTNGNVVSHIRSFFLPPSSSLPDEADTFDCLYCPTQNIHHPDLGIKVGFHNGREDHWESLSSQIKKFSLKSEGKGFLPMISHPGLGYFGRYYKDPRTVLATVALNLFNSVTKGANFKLVKVGSFGGGFTSIGVLKRINFEAKNKDDPDSPVQTFFAEIIRSGFFILAAFCECLGPSHLVLPEEPKKHGCMYCARSSSRVHHPPGPGYLNGRECYEMFL